MDIRIAARAALLASVVGLPFGASPGWAASLSLPQAIERAEAQAPLLEARSATTDAAREEAARAGRLPDPMLMLGIDNLPVTGGDAFDPAADEMTMKRIGLRQDVPAAAERSARRDLAARVVQQAEVDAVVERLTLRRAVADAWINAWAAGHRLRALDGLREHTVLTARVAKARVRAGAGTPAEALAAEAAILEVDNEILAAQSERRAAIAILAQWLPEANDALEMPDPTWDSLPFAEATLRARVEELSPLLADNAAIDRASAEVSLARAESRPDWSVAAYYGQRDGGRSDMIGLEVGIELPLFRRNRQDRAVAAREADVRAAQATLEARRRQVAAHLEAALARWHALQRQVELYETSLLPLTRDRTAVASAAYRGGGELQPWLDARQAELGVIRSHADHRGELGHAWVALATLLPETTP